MTGMNLQEVQEMMGLIKRLRENRGITIALVEHNIRAVMGLCDRIAVLNFGQKIAEGAPGEISQNQAVIKAYLGGSL
jgi:branched-chain amino acid transport system ATP-binding protein